MNEYGFTGRIAQATARRPWLTVGVWVALLVAGTFAASRVGDVLTQEQDVLVEVEAEQAQELIDLARSSAGLDISVKEFVLVIGQDGATLQDAAFQQAVADLTTQLRQTEHVVSVLSPTDGIPTLTNADGTIALIQATLDTIEWTEAADAAEPLVAVVERADASSPERILTVGTGSINIEFNHLAEQTLQRGETIGLPIALLVLVIVFGAVVAALIPLGLAVLAIIMAIGMSTLVGQFTDLNFFIVNMITMIGLAVGIDYSLFVIQRFREERLAGREVIDAVAVAGETATRAVFFSGVTVVIALLGLMIMPETTMRSLGIGAILAVFAAVLAAVTLLPAILRLLGDRVNRLRVPFTHRSSDTSHRFWTRITSTVTARPIVSILLAAGLLLGAASPYLTMEIGSNFIASLPEDSNSRIGFETLNEQFLGGVITTPIVVQADDVTDPAIQAAVAQLATALEQDTAYGAVAVTPVADENLVLVEANTLVDPSTREGRDAIKRLRTEQIPQAFDNVDARALVGGDIAFMTDFVEVITSRTGLIFAFVLGLSFLLLLLAFRSIVVPLKAIVMNLLSVGAAYGLLVLVFQHGVGAGVLGLQQTDVIESWVPLFLFAVLFGLSMDYHVFLLSRIKERYDLTGDNSGSVAFGLSVTGSIITGAALIMVAVFGGFAAGDLVMFQQMGFGLGVAVMLDATIVRSVLVPATMELLGDRNWYFPTWLEWLPDVHVEGTRHRLPTAIAVAVATEAEDLAETDVPARRQTVP